MDNARAGEIARAAEDWIRRSVDANLQGDDGHFLLSVEARPMIQKRDPDDNIEVWTATARMRFTPGADQGRAQRVFTVLDASSGTVTLDAAGGIASISCDGEYDGLEKSPDPAYPLLAVLDVGVQVL